MGTLLVGLLVVTAGAVGFGLALFGRRPVPQPATQLFDAPRTPTSNRPDASGWRIRLREVLPTAIRPREGHAAADVTITRWVRIRAALVLALTVVGLAAIIGGVLSVIVVGLVLIVT